MPYCCEEMTRQVEYSCDLHRDLSDCPDSLVVHVNGTGEFGLRVHDGGSSFIVIRHCPWCGAHLQSGDAPPSTSVCLLWHVHRFDDDEDEKLLGVYASEQAAREAQRRLADQPGFREHPDGFEIDTYEVGKDHWTKGFTTVTAP